MKTKILTVALTVLFINIFFTLISHYDRVNHFIPFIKIFSNGRFEIDAYSFFLIITILCFRLIYISCGVRISLSSIGSILQAFRYMRMFDIGILAGAGFITQFFLCPFLYQICIEPLSDIRHAPDSLRRIVLVMLPMLWILLLGLINKGGIGLWSSSNRTMSKKTQVMSRPTTW